MILLSQTIPPLTTGLYPNSRQLTLNRSTTITSYTTKRGLTLSALPALLHPRLSPVPY